MDAVVMLTGEGRRLFNSAARLPAPCVHVIAAHQAHASFCCPVPRLRSLLCGCMNRLGATQQQ